MEPTLQSPQSATWQVHIDRSMWVGGVRSLMLQALHPIAMRGVWQNSGFQEDPIGRLQRTADFVGVVTWGTADEADRLGRKVRDIHRILRIKDPDTGRIHRVDEPELLLWVHCAEVYSYLDIARRSGLRLSDQQADQYLAEQRRSATYVGLHEEDVPGSVAEMEAFFAEMRPQLKVTPEARSTVKFLLWPRLPQEMRMNALPERLHDLSFQQTTKDMLDAARQRLATEGYDLRRGLYGLRKPRRWPSAAA